MADSEAPEQFPSSLPDVGALQFRRAQPIVSAEPSESRTCEACKQLITGGHYQVNNHVICPGCAAKIQAGRQVQRPVPWVRLVIFGAGAALAGSILYAIPLAMGFQIGIVALVVGWMVGKAIRHGSYGTGGRAQQVLAVVLTYFAISASIVPALVFMGVKQGAARAAQKKPPEVQPVKPMPSAGKMAAGVALLVIVSPFLQLKSSPIGGLISLFILFIGLQRAWVLTARHEIIVTGPYS
jgi:hypothetical protein